MIIYALYKKKKPEKHVYKKGVTVFSLKNYKKRKEEGRMLLFFIHFSSIISWNTGVPSNTPILLFPSFLLSSVLFLHAAVSLLHSPDP